MQRFSSQDKEFKTFMTLEAYFSSTSISYTKLQDLQLKHGTWSAFFRIEGW
jgi:hypothetical protein